MPVTLNLNSLAENVNKSTNTTHNKIRQAQTPLPILLVVPSLPLCLCSGGSEADGQW